MASDIEKWVAANGVTRCPEGTRAMQGKATARIRRRRKEIEGEIPVAVAVYDDSRYERQMEEAAALSGRCIGFDENGRAVARDD